VLLRAGLADADIKLITYNNATPDFTRLGPEVKDFNPDGVLIIGFNETADAINELFKVGIKSRRI
jgi:hypothetical protein